MRKRVALAQTFINEPQILLMDEPFSALDVQTRELMQDELLQPWSEAKSSVIFVTHDLEEAIALSDKVYVLTRDRRGEIRLSDPPAKAARSSRTSATTRLSSISPAPSGTICATKCMPAPQRSGIRRSHD